MRCVGLREGGKRSRDLDGKVRRRKRMIGAAVGCMCRR